MSAPDFTLVLCPLWGARSPWTAPAYLLEAVKSAGYKVQYLDYNIRLYWETGAPLLWRASQHELWKAADLDGLLDRIDLTEIAAPVVGFSLTETNIRFSVALARRLRRHDPSRTILFGGHGVFFPEEAGEKVSLDVCDAIVKGEGEATLLEILAGGLRANPGTYTPGGKRWVFNGERPLLPDLDAYPWPRYEEVDWRLFPSREMSVMGSRGCVNRCVFCDDLVRAGHRFRRRSAAHVAEEMRYHRDANGIRFTVFNDSILNGDLRGLDELCGRLIEDGHDRPWVGNFAVRRAMPLELMRKARRAGFTTAMVGLESGSSRVLSLMRKPFDAGDAAWFLTSLHEAGIGVALNLIVGFPGETEEDFQETLRFLARLAPRVTQIVSISPFMLNRSHLSDHLADFGVRPGVSDERGHMGALDWTTEDGRNTWDVRLDRYRRLTVHAHALGLIGDWWFGEGDEVSGDSPAAGGREKEGPAPSPTRNAPDRFRAVYVWGSDADGQRTRNILESRGRPVAGFVDDEPRLWYRLVQGLIVHPPSVLGDGDRGHPGGRPFVVVGPEPGAGTLARLTELGLEEPGDVAKAADALRWPPSTEPFASPAR